MAGLLQLYKPMLHTVLRCSSSTLHILNESWQVLPCTVHYCWVCSKFALLHTQLDRWKGSEYTPSLNTVYTCTCTHMHTLTLALKKEAAFLRTGIIWREVNTARGQLSSPNTSNSPSRASATTHRLGSRDTQSLRPAPNTWERGKREMAALNTASILA